MTSILKEFLAYDKKTIDDVIMDYTHTIGFIRMDTSTFKWLETQDKIEKLDYYGVIDKRFTLNPWLFRQAMFLLMGMGFDSFEEVLTCYAHESGLLFFTIDSSGYFVIVCPVIDVKKEESINNGGERA